MDVLGKVGLEQNIEKTLNNVFETTRKEIEELSLSLTQISIKLTAPKLWEACSPYSHIGQNLPF